VEGFDSQMVGFFSTFTAWYTFVGILDISSVILIRLYSIHIRLCMPRVPLIISFVNLYHKYQVRVDGWRDEEREREREERKCRNRGRRKRERNHLGVTSEPFRN
jgi:hypothetical protein